MNVNDRIIPADVSWVDYCDALATDMWHESQKKSLPAKKLDSRIELRDKNKSDPIPNELAP